MELSYVKDVKGFDVKVSSNYSMVSQIPDYGANLEISNKFQYNLKVSKKIFS